ncbi:MAG: N-acetyltransferase [Synechococcaceae cyanobacterium]|nr:N-acetyltransferase [Synechococcaceae cyanobacterium]
MAPFPSLLMPFRSPHGQPRLPQGYTLLHQPELCWDRLNVLLEHCGEQQRPHARWQRALERSSWHLGVVNGSGLLVGFLRVTSDQALNANIWDLLVDPQDPARGDVIPALVQTALARLRREMAGCSVSLAAPPEALDALTRAGFVVDPGGIRAMGLTLRQP